MIFIVCSCGKGLRVSPGPDLVSLLIESEWYPNNFPCPFCEGRAGMVDGLDPVALAQLHVVDVVPMEAFLAFSGMGLPAERDCSAAALEKILTDAKIVKVLATQIRNSHRAILHGIELEDGTKVFLGSSSYGATVYRIAPKHSYTEEELRADAR